MEKVINFIVENHEILILLAACLLDVVLFLVGVFKKKQKAPMDVVLTAVPYYIKAAEEFIGADKGQEKKDWVMKYLSKTYKNLTGVELLPGSVLFEDLSKFVEKVLETPTKKGK